MTITEMHKNDNMRMFRMTPYTILIEVRTTYETGKGERACVPSHSIDYFCEKHINSKSHTLIVLKSGHEILSTTTYNDFLSQIVEVDDAS